MSAGEVTTSARSPHLISEARPPGPTVPGIVPSTTLSGVRVLFAEDDPHTRVVVQWLLEQSGAGVTAAASAAEAVDAYRGGVREGGGFDVLVSDIAMPDRDGYQLLRDLRQLERTTDGGLPPVRALALTAHAGDGNRTRALDAGFEAHLVKPVEPAVLVATVARLIRRDPATGPSR